MSHRKLAVSTAILVLTALSFPALAGEKAEVCHPAGAGQHVIDVSENAVPAHLAHGDHLVGEELCDNGVDDDCDGVVDDDCCPCFTLDELLTWFDSGDQCFDFDVGTPETPVTATFVADYTPPGLAAGVQNTPGLPPFCAVIDLTNTGLVELGITPAEYATCRERVLAATDTLGIACSDVPPEE